MATCNRSCVYALGCVLHNRSLGAVLVPEVLESIQGGRSVHECADYKERKEGDGEPWVAPIPVATGQIAHRCCS